MGSNAFVLSKDSKEYIWLGKKFDVEGDKDCAEALERFLRNHIKEHLVFGFAQDTDDLVKKVFHASYDFKIFNEEYKELSYSHET